MCGEGLGDMVMAEVMKIDEIEARFPDEWILVIDPDTGPDLKVRSGVVAAHSKDRDEVDRKSLELRPRRCAIWFNGEPSDDTVIVL
jgi:hypothetical protein